MMTKSQKLARPTRRHARELDGGDAFLHDPRWSCSWIKDGDVEAFGEEFLVGATSNEAIGELARDEAYATELVSFGFDDTALARGR